MSRTLKIATVWLLLATMLFLAIQAWMAQRSRPRVLVAAGGVVELSRALDGHFHWPARVNGRELVFLVDTGATRTSLPGPVAKALGLGEGRPVQSATAGGVARGHEVRVDLELEGGFHARDLRVTVLPDLGSPLLGMDVLSRLRFSQHDGVLRLQAPAPGG